MPLKPEKPECLRQCERWSRVGTGTQRSTASHQCSLTDGSIQSASAWPGRSDCSHITSQSLRYTRATRGELPEEGSTGGRRAPLHVQRYFCDEDLSTFTCTLSGHPPHSTSPHQNLDSSGKVCRHGRRWSEEPRCRAGNKHDHTAATAAGAPQTSPAS